MKRRMTTRKGGKRSKMKEDEGYGQGGIKRDGEHNEKIREKDRNSEKKRKKRFTNNRTGFSAINTRNEDVNKLPSYSSPSFTLLLTPSQDDHEQNSSIPHVKDPSNSCHSRSHTSSLHPFILHYITWNIISPCAVFYVLILPRLLHIS